MLSLKVVVNEVFGGVALRIPHHHGEIRLEVRGQGRKQLRIEGRLADEVRDLAEASKECMALISRLNRSAH